VRITASILGGRAGILRASEKPTSYSAANLSDVRTIAALGGSPGYELLSINDVKDARWTDGRAL
jgi:hypothetical protein